MPHASFRHLVIGLLVLVALLFLVLQIAILGGGPGDRVLQAPFVPSVSGAR